MRRTVEGFDAASLSLSNRLDMEPLGPHDVLPAWEVAFPSGVADVPDVEIYMDALPLPGRTGGTRFTTTEEDLGITCESSFNSATSGSDQSDEAGPETRQTNLLQTNRRT
jgi:hypothetical protein